jgi:hypothetical protein
MNVDRWDATAVDWQILTGFWHEGSESIFRDEQYFDCYTLNIKAVRSSERSLPMYDAKFEVLTALSS